MKKNYSAALPAKSNHLPVGQWLLSIKSKRLPLQGVSNMHFNLLLQCISVQPYQVNFGQLNKNFP